MEQLDSSVTVKTPSLQSERQKGGVIDVHQFHFRQKGNYYRCSSVSFPAIISWFLDTS